MPLRNLARETVVQSLGLTEQRHIIAQARSVCERSPLVRPILPGGTPMRVRVTSAGSLGWVADGSYRYTPTDPRGRPWPEIPELWKDIADAVAGPHPWDCALLNWYDAGASLGWHRDLSERDLTLPVVTLSLGDACSWAVRIDDGPISRTQLESGEVTLLAGSNRLALHSVESISPSPLLSPLPSRGRVSISLRVAG